VVEIIQADYIYTPDGYERGKAVAFNSKILAIDSLDKLKSDYPKASVYCAKENSILYPGFINNHIHLEFSSNRTTLKYGDFIDWLGSIIEHRESLLNILSNQDMNLACNEMLESGVTTFGAISSFGSDLEVCQKTPQKVIYFNEVIGSEPSMLDTLYKDFLSRVEAFLDR